MVMSHRISRSTYEGCAKLISAKSLGIDRAKQAGSAYDLQDQPNSGFQVNLTRIDQNQPDQHASASQPIQASTRSCVEVTT